MAKGSCLPAYFTVFFLSVHVEYYFFDATRHIYFFPDVTGHASSSCHIAGPLLICVRDMCFLVCVDFMLLRICCHVLLHFLN